MQVVRTGDGTVRQAPIEGGPRVEVLVGEGEGWSRNIAAAHVVVPPGGGMPQHDHGNSEALVMVQSGRLTIECDDQKKVLEPGHLVTLWVGERVGLTNDSSEPAILLAFFSPPMFVRTLVSWPVAETS